MSPLRTFLPRTWSETKRSLVGFWLLLGQAVLVLAISLSFAFVTADQNTQLAQQALSARRTEHALCILQDDLRHRIEVSQRFLRKHPDGIPGIPAAVIRQGIDNQRQTLDSLSILQCGGFH